MPTVSLTSVASGMTGPSSPGYASFVPSWYTPVCDIYLVTIEFTQDEVPVGCVPRALPSYSYPGGGKLFPIGPSPYWDLGPTLGYGWASPNLCRLTALSSPGWATLYSTTDNTAMIYAPSGTSDNAYFSSTYLQNAKYIGYFEKYNGTATNAGGYTVASIDRYYFIVNLYNLDFYVFDDSLQGSISIGINDTSGNMASIFGGTDYVHLIIDSYSGYDNHIKPVYPESGSVYLNPRPIPCVQRQWTYPEYDHRNQHRASMISHTGGTPDTQDVVMRCGEIPSTTPTAVSTFRLNWTTGFWIRPGVSARIVVYGYIFTIAGTTHTLFWYNALGKLINAGGTVFSGTAIGIDSDWYETGMVTPPAGAVYLRTETENGGTTIQNTLVFFPEQICPPHWATLYGDWCPGNYLKFSVTPSDFP